MISKIGFWTLVAGLLAFVAKFFAPDFPFSNEQILSAILFALGSVGITPTVKLFALRRGVVSGASALDLFKSLQFWALVVGLAVFVIHFYAPTFPFGQAELLALVVYILGFFDIHPQLRANNLL